MYFFLLRKNLKVNLGEKPIDEYILKNNYNYFANFNIISLSWEVNFAAWKKRNKEEIWLKYGEFRFHVVYESYFCWNFTDLIFILLWWLIRAKYICLIIFIENLKFKGILEQLETKQKYIVMMPKISYLILILFIWLN